MLDRACGVFFRGGSRGHKGRGGGGGGHRKWGRLSRQREHLLHWLLDTQTHSRDALYSRDALKKRSSMVFLD